MDGIGHAHSGIAVIATMSLHTTSHDPVIEGDISLLAHQLKCAFPKFPRCLYTEWLQRMRLPLTPGFGGAGIPWLAISFRKEASLNLRVLRAYELSLRAAGQVS